MHLAVSCVGQSVPVAWAPLAHVHTFRLHTRSVVAVSSVLSYWAAVQVVWAVHVPQCNSVYAVDRNCAAPHVFTALHSRLTVADGGVPVWQVTPNSHSKWFAHEATV